ncbi:MAG: tRNA lysidine(34) synthetase TilS [Porcipelethomonas sp.]
MLTDRIINTISTYSMLEGCNKLTAALSGGADSVCLLRILHEICPRYGVSLDAIHINHEIRGEESDRDEDFCRRLCEKLDIPFTAVRYDVPGYAKEKKLSIEEAAREIRYEIFSSHMHKNGKIATAHTASDNAETVLINLVRGTGLKGLAGIPPVRDKFIRPLIEITRNDVEAYLKSIDQDFITDSTNLSLDYTRNKIRHIVIPALTEINSSFVSTVSSESGIISDENEYIEKHAEEVFEKCFENGRLRGLSGYPPVIVNRCVMKFLKSEKIPVNHERIKAVADIAVNGGKINVSSGTYVICRKDILYISRNENTCCELSVPLETGENTIFPSKKLLAFEGENGTVCMDHDKIKGRMILRNRRFGDKIQLAGRNFNSSVKKLLNEKIPGYERPYIHFIEDEEGLIFIENIGIAERVKVTEKTDRFFSVTIEETG